MPKTSAAKESLAEAVNHEFGLIAVLENVTVVHGRPSTFGTYDAAMMASTIPEVHLDTEGKFGRRRSRLTVDTPAGSAVLVARRRGLPADPAEPWLHVQTATDGWNRQIPISCVDRDSRRLHLLVDLEGARVESPEPRGEGPAIIADALFAEPLRALVRDAAPRPWIGTDVHGQMQALLTASEPDPGEPALRELAFFERLGDAEGMPPVVRRRLETLRRLSRNAARRRASSSSSRTVDMAYVRREVGRVQQLITSRACAWLRFSARGITGLANPRRLSGDWNQRALMFQLLPRNLHTGGALEVWDPAAVGRKKRRMCLGEAIGAYQEMVEGMDVYGLIDVTLDFFETNLIGAVPAVRTAPRRRFRDIMLSCF